MFSRLAGDVQSNSYCQIRLGRMECSADLAETNIFWSDWPECSAKASQWKFWKTSSVLELFRGLSPFLSPFSFVQPPSWEPPIPPPGSRELEAGGAGTRLGRAGSRDGGGTLWPPKQVITDIGKLTPIQAEASVGRYTGAAPPLPEWPFYESQMSLEELQALDAKDEEMLKRLTFVDFADQLTRAYVLASRWQKSNLGRSAGFDRLGIGILSGFMFTNPVLMRQLQGLNVLQNYVAEKCQDDAPEDEAPRKTRLPAASPETFAAFLRSVEAGETIAAEFAAVAPVERETFVEGLVSSQGSALAMWTQEPESGLAEVHFCIGHDCLKEGPEVEDLLMRLVARKAQAQGAQRLRARARFTEKGKLLVPCPKLQFQLAPGEREFAEDASDAEAMSNRDFTKPKDYYAIPEAVEGLRTWLLVLCLEDRLEEANGWCQEMGAATLDEVIESREDLAEYLEQQAPLTAGEKQALLERDH
ncbi:unnamed protein product [Durusdinium trenchii]|uniref:Uncharacterized protein n=1 Tax=Durusdinium trenchii TaxID=1381693 RepID=A0ABP0KKZ6_9DINO